MGGLDRGGQLARLGDGGGQLGLRLTRELEGDVDAGVGGVVGEEPVEDLGARQGDVAGPVQIGRRVGGRAGDQVLDDQVVLFRVGVLEVGDRVDPDGVGNLPGPLGELLDGGEGLRCEDLAVRRARTTNMMLSFLV